MTLNRRLLFLPVLAVLAACGGDDGGGPPPATSTPTALATSTATSLPASTATSLPSSTATSVPTFTSTSAPTATATVTETRTPRAVGAKALFTTDGLSPANPFPSDRLRDETGHIAVTGALIGADLPPDAKYNTARSLANTVAEQLKQLSGFSTFAPIRIKFEKEVALPPDDSNAFFLVDCDRESEVPVRYLTTNPLLSGDYALEVYPLEPLRPKTRYAYFVTQDLLDAEGKPVFPTLDFIQAIMSETGPLSDWRLQVFCGLDATLSSRGVLPEDLVVADTFTTQPTVDDLVAIGERFRLAELAAPVPVFENSPIAGLVTGIFEEGTPQFEAIVGTPTSDHIAKVAVGSFPSFDFRKNSSAFDPDFVYGEATPPAVNLDFYMTFPKAPMPEDGYPVVIFGHGLGGSSRDVVVASRLFGDAPLVGIGISAVQHGRRGNVSMFFNLVDGFATREHFRQTVVDLMQLTNMIRSTTAAPFDVVDETRINYLGVSLGGIMGTVFMGIEDDVRVAVLSVPGGGLPNIIQSQAIGQLLKPLISLTVSIPQNDVNFPAFFHRFTHLSQWVIDAGDPINMAPYILGPNSLPDVPPKKILMQEGITDVVVPNATTEDLARAMGLADAKATLGCQSLDGCSGIWRYVMTEYGFQADSGHGVTGLVDEAAAQATQFLVSDGTLITDASPQP